MKKLLLILPGLLLLAACLPATPEAEGDAAPATAILLPPASPTAPLAASATPPAAASPAPPQSSPTPAAPLPTDTPPAAAEAPQLDPGRYALREVAQGFTRPLLLTHAGDGSGRLFVVEQPGVIRVIQNGAVLPELFLDLQAIVGSEGNEQGLLGLAFHPEYAANGHFFANYTDLNGDTVVARYTAAADDANRADPASAQILLQVAQPYANHNGGHLAFGPDGYLYVGLGDGGSAGDPQGSGQRLDTLLGKLLRLDVDQAPYAVPPDNPFVGRADARAEIWALGLRNPWRFSFDRLTGDLYIADVGQNAYEEVNVQPAASPGGENYGWNFMEASHPYRGQPPAGLTAPVAEYSHADGCSITGGYVYRGALLPGLQGVYLYADYCTGQLWTLYQSAAGWQTARFFDAPFSISAFGQDDAGELYLLDHRGGRAYQIVPAP